MVSTVKALAAVVALTCVAVVSGAEVNLTPQYSVRELEGCKFPQLEFRDGNRKITYEAPPGWQAVARDSQTLALSPPGRDMVSAKIKFIPTPGTLVLDESQLKYFRETAHLLLPPESRIMVEPTITPNPVSLNGHATCEVDIYFVLHDQRMRMSVLFVDLGGSQLRFSLISRPGDFDELHKAFRDSWYTWQWADAPQASLAAAK